jgi:hypothetical protein
MMVAMCYAQLEMVLRTVILSLPDVYDIFNYSSKDKALTTLVL